MGFLNPNYPLSGESGGAVQLGRDVIATALVQIKLVGLSIGERGCATCAETQRRKERKGLSLTSVHRVIKTYTPPLSPERGKFGFQKPISLLLLQIPQTQLDPNSTTTIFLTKTFLSGQFITRQLISELFLPILIIAKLYCLFNSGKWR